MSDKKTLVWILERVAGQVESDSAQVYISAGTLRQAAAELSRLQSTRDQRLISALGVLYESGCSLKVAELCDEQLDPSGALLGKVREFARALKSKPPPKEKEKRRED